MAVSSSLGLVLLVALISYICIGSAVNYRKLTAFKGPPLAAFSRLWLWRQSLGQRSHLAQKEALEKYGSPVRIGPNLLVTDDPDLFRHMNAPRSRWTRGTWYDGMKMDPRMNNILSERDERKHADMRAKMIGAYSGKEIDTLESDVDERVLELVTLVKTYGGQPMDFAHIAQFFTLDVLSQLAFGEKFGYMDANADLYDYNKTSADFLPILEWMTNHPSIRWILTSAPMQALAAPKGSDAIGQGKIIGIAQKAVAARFGPDAKYKRDMLGHFVSKGLTQEQAEVESHLQIMAGAESTSSALRTTFMLLLGSPAAYAKLNAEIKSAIEAGKVSYPVVTATETQQLPYLQAVIWEGLRLWPPLFGLQAKMAPPGGETVNGIFFPGGTEIAICGGAVGRKKAVFGADADIFRPERWIESDAATKDKYMKTAEIIFGAGRFVCLGKTIAMMELGKAIVELLRGYDWAIADPLRGVDSVSHGINVIDNMNLVAWSKQR